MDTWIAAREAEAAADPQRPPDCPPRVWVGYSDTDKAARRRMHVRELEREHFEATGASHLWRGEALGVKPFAELISRQRSEP
jgi:hypothetical protein